MEDRRLAAYVQTRITAAKDCAKATQFAVDAERQLIEYLAERLAAGATCAALSRQFPREMPRWMRSRALKTARGKYGPNLQHTGQRAFDYYIATERRQHAKSAG